MLFYLILIYIAIFGFFRYMWRLIHFFASVQFVMALINICFFQVIMKFLLESIEQSQLEDAKEVLAGKAYHWRDWCICRGRDCLYIWSDAAALELSNGSNGWFRFILDGKLATMYSSGSPEGGADTSGETLGFIQLDF